MPRLAEGGWQSIEEGDRERLKWAGVFFRRQTPGQFMMRVRMSNGLSNARQFRALADISREFDPVRPTSPPGSRFRSAGFRLRGCPRFKQLDKVGLDRFRRGWTTSETWPGAVAGLTRTSSSMPRQWPANSRRRFCATRNYEPPAKVQRDDHGMPRALCARRISGPRAGAGDCQHRWSGSPGLQRPRRRQDGFRRLSGRRNP